MAQMSDKLNAQQKAFCEAMIKTNHNQTQAYAMAYPDASYETCNKNGNKLMKMDKVINYINELEEEALKQAGITPARIANELAKQAFADIDLDTGLTYQVKQNAMKMLQSQFGLDKKVIEADVKTTVIDINIED